MNSGILDCIAGVFDRISGIVDCISDTSASGWVQGKHVRSGGMAGTIYVDGRL